MDRKIRLMRYAAIAALALIPVPGAWGQAIDMKIGFVTINDPQHVASQWFADEIAKRTQGRVTARLFPAAQLGGIPRQVEAIQLGTQEAFHTPPAFFVGTTPAFQAADAPGLFDSLDHQHATLNHPKVRDKWLHLAEGAGIIGIYTFAAAEGAIATREPVRKIADMKGRKLRVLATKMETAIMNEFGVTGVPMDYAEIIGAIQNRVIDGARSAIIVMGPSKFYTVARYVTILGDNFIPSGMWLSKVWFDKLPADIRKSIQDTARDLTPVALAATKAAAKHWETEWAKSGGEVIRLSAAEHAEFMRRVKPLGDEILGGNPRVKEMYELLKTVAAETRR
jgi:TRAP-type C4-dicarboxylate transport system substrate-binding protein